MFHTSAYFGAVTTGAVLIAIAPVADTICRVSGNDLIVPPLSKLMWVAGVGNTNSRLQLSSPSLRRIALLEIKPLNIGTVFEGPARIIDYSAEPLDLAAFEQLDAFSVQTGGGTVNEYAILAFCDGPVKPLLGEIFTIRVTGTTTLTANAWTNGAIVFDQNLPVGIYAIVGARFASTGLLAYRFVLLPAPGVPPAIWRPGMLGAQAVDGLDYQPARRGGFGEWGRFSTLAQPTVDYLSISADTAETGEIDLIQVSTSATG